MDPALEPLTTLHFRECPLAEDAVLTDSCWNCGTLVRANADECPECHETVLSFGGPWHGPEDCQCSEIEEDMELEEAERRAEW
jgi:RNA polymerase subunit RPABC4/transcription elongation factor Spt4